LTACFAFCCAMFGFALTGQTAPANQIRRIYVEPFTTEASSEKFREGVIAENRSISPSQNAHLAILAGISPRVATGGIRERQSSWRLTSGGPCWNARVGHTAASPPGAQVRWS
jgi:hypothetical protein